MVEGKLSYSLFQQCAAVKLIQKITWEISAEINTLFSYLLKELHLTTLYIDMSETTYIDSTILGIIVHCKKRSSDQGIKIILCSPSKPCENILSDIGMDKVFEINRGFIPKLEVSRELPVEKKMTTLEIELLIRDAHEELMNMNEHNRELFSPVVNTIENEKQSENKNN